MQNQVIENIIYVLIFSFFILFTVLTLTLYFNEPFPDWYYNLRGKNPPEIIKCKFICPPYSDYYATKSLMCCDPETIEKVQKSK